MKPSRHISRVYLQLLSIKLKIVAYTNSSRKKLLPTAYIIFIIENFPSAINLSKTTDTSHSKELSNSVKIYTNDVKYNAYKNSFIFKLPILYDICSKADLLFKVKIKRFSLILKSSVLNKYPSNIGINNSIINFDQVCYSIKKK